MPPLLTRTPVTAWPSNDQADDPCAVADLDARVCGPARSARSTRPGPPPTDFDRQPAPELELAVDLVGLAAIDRHESNALVLQPFQRIEGTAHQALAQFRVGAEAGNPEHVVEKLVGRVGSEIRIGDLVVRQVRHQGFQVVDPVIGDAEGAGGKAAVAAVFVFRRAFQHQHGRALFARRHGRAEGRVAGADHDDVETVGCHIWVPSASRAVPPASGASVAPVSCDAICSMSSRARQNGVNTPLTAPPLLH